MKKILLSSAITLASTAAFAQDYNYNYYGYNDQMAQSEPTYYTNEVTVEEAAEMQYGYMPMQAVNTYERNWDLSVMVGVAHTPEYKGGKDNELKAIIAPKAEYRLDEWQKLYLSLDQGAGYSYALTRNLEIGGGLGYRTGRDSSDASILSGMSDVDDTLTYLAFAKYNMGQYNLGIKMEKGMDSSNDGMSTELSAGYRTKLSPQLVVGTSVSAIYGDDTYMEQNFGVSTADAVPGRSAFNADAGFHEANLKVFSNYNIAGPHNVTASVKYSKLLGDAKDSTIVEDDTSVSAAVGYSYKF
tara:strand:+ start:19 stop:915 length:897 start_codon:yes stop_codon:yes gene_type:complete